MKFFCVSNGYEKSIEKLDAEIAKCDIVCATHHRVRTWKRRQFGGQIAKDRLAS
jgi:hypothetical protein